MGIVNSRDIIVDIQHMTIEIKGFTKGMYIHKYAFKDIKSIIFFDEKEHVVDYGESWKTHVRITDISNKIIFYDIISKAFNYNKLEELCSSFFLVDYIILNENNYFLYFPRY
jgi:hypothetical protein